jgi:hypothetical protein
MNNLADYQVGDGAIILWALVVSGE